MKQWMTQKLIAPRWIFLAIVVLSIASFSALYVKAHDLDNKLHLTEIELKEAKSPYRLIWVLNIPFIATLWRFPEMLFGFLCSLGVVTGAIWILVQKQRCGEKNERRIETNPE